MFYPIIYPSNETAFTTLGYGALSDCISCKVTEVLNGEFSLELKYPKDGIFVEYLQPRNVILCRANWSTDREAFRIYKVNRTMKSSVTVYAYQLSYDLSNLPILPGTATDLTNAISMLNTAAGANFTVSTNRTSNSDFKVDVPSSVRSWFGGKQGSIIDIYGGEWYFHLWLCNLRTSRGSDNGLRVAYGVNLAEYQKESNDSVYSHVLAYYARDINDVFTVVVGTSVATGYTAFSRTLIYDASEYFGDTVPTSAQLTSFATSYASTNNAKLTHDQQTIVITPELLETQEISMGDTVHVCYDDAVVSTRVVKTIWDVMADRYEKVELGTLKTNIADTIKSLVQ